MHPDIKDTSRGELGHAVLSLPNSCSSAYAAQEPPTAPASAFLLGGICPAARTGGWEGMDRTGSRGPLFLGEEQHDLGRGELLMRGWSRDPVAFSKKFGQTVMMLLEENLLNAVKSHIANKRSLLYALYASCKVYSINNYMLFCSPQMKWLEFLMPLLRLPVRGDAHFLLSPKAPFSSDCFQYFFILLVSFRSIGSLHSWEGTEKNKISWFNL